MIITCVAVVFISVLQLFVLCHWGTTLDKMRTCRLSFLYTRFLVCIQAFLFVYTLSCLYTGFLVCIHAFLFVYMLSCLYTRFLVCIQAFSIDFSFTKKQFDLSQRQWAFGIGIPVCI